jgi:hypothetical protein
MAKIHAEAARLGKDVSHESGAHCRSVFFLCKGALGIPWATTQGDQGGSKQSLGLRQLRLLGPRQGVDLSSAGLNCVLHFN